MALVAVVGSSQSYSPTSGGKVWPFNNIGTAPIQVVVGNPNRVSITFANPGTQNIFVAPLTTATGASLMPSLGALGGCFPVVSGAMMTLTGEVQVGWQALAPSGLNNPLTVMESNI
jgi:hypothetical protein